MHTRSIPRITTIEGADAALVAFDNAYWYPQHARGLPTIRHTMHHLFASITTLQREIGDVEDRGLSVVQPAEARVQNRFAGVLLEQALRIANNCLNCGSLPSEWRAGMGSQGSSLYGYRGYRVELAMNGVISGPYARLNQYVLECEDGHAPVPNLMECASDLAHIAFRACDGSTSPTEWSVNREADYMAPFAERLVRLYAKHDVTVTFVDPVSP